MTAFQAHQGITVATPSTYPVTDPEDNLEAPRRGPDVYRTPPGLADTILSDDKVRRTPLFIHHARQNVFVIAATDATPFLNVDKDAMAWFGGFDSG
jgi:hypothetical protein